jgi:hypothetical protein
LSESNDELEARIKELESQLEKERKLFHIARILRMRKVENEGAYIQKMLLLPVEQLDQLATVVEDTSDVKSSHQSSLPGVS